MYFVLFGEGMGQDMIQFPSLDEAWAFAQTCPSLEVQIIQV